LLSSEETAEETVVTSSMRSVVTIGGDEDIVTEFFLAHSGQTDAAATGAAAS
jgi:hypothetical protein